MSEISDFLAKNPSLSEIVEYVEKEAQRIAFEKKASEGTKS